MLLLMMVWKRNYWLIIEEDVTGPIVKAGPGTWLGHGQQSALQVEDLRSCGRSPYSPPPWRARCQCSTS